MDDCDPGKYVNDPSIEMAWAIKAAEAASVHMNLIMSPALDTTKLKLNKHQDIIYNKFREDFPELDIIQVDEKALKFENKDKWRSFCDHFVDLDDYNTGTILRIRADDIYSEENTIITPKVIFLAIEGARNQEGINQKYKTVYSAKYRSTDQTSGHRIV